MTCECDACERMHQWDSNQTVDFDGKTGETVDFATDDAGTAVTVKAENGSAKVPAELLQQTDAIKAYLRNGGNTVAEKTICVEGRAKPSDYVADPTDQLTASEAVETAQAAANESASSASYAKDSADAAMQFAAETAGSAEDAADSASKAAASAAAAKEAAENPVLPIASASALGAIKVGENLSIADDGTLNAQAGGGIKASVDMSSVGVISSGSTVETDDADIAAVFSDIRNLFLDNSLSQISVSFFVEDDYHTAFCRNINQSLDLFNFVVSISFDKINAYDIWFHTGRNEEGYYTVKIVNKTNYPIKNIKIVAW